MLRREFGFSPTTIGGGGGEGGEAVNTESLVENGVRKWFSFYNLTSLSLSRARFYHLGFFLNFLFFPDVQGGTMSDRRGRGMV